MLLYKVRFENESLSNLESEEEEDIGVATGLAFIIFVF